jgi:LacI family transcriptional regulator
METDSSWGRNVIRGIADFAANFGPWNLLVDPRDRGQHWSLPEEWRGDGIIARISTPLQLDRVRHTSLPTVSVSDTYADIPGVGMVWTDERQLAQLALAHLRERGFQHFGYFAPPSNDYSMRRGVQFAMAVAATGLKCHQYKPGYRSGRNINREEQQRRVARWLEHLDRPVGILAVDALRGRQLAEICQMKQIRVPDEVAILAGDTDELFCELCTPPLSSIRIASRRIGTEAASLLHRLMQGASVPHEPQQIPPVGVTSRLSTNALSIDDPLVVQALRFIQTHACSGIVVDDILKNVPVSKRFLERRFREYLGRLPGEEIRRLRLERAKQLLTDSDLSIEEVAIACGYAGSTQFSGN